MITAAQVQSIGMGVVSTCMSFKTNDIMFYSNALPERSNGDFLFNTESTLVKNNSHFASFACSTCMCSRLITKTIVKSHLCPEN